MDDLVAIVDMPAIVAMAAVGTGMTEKQLRKTREGDAAAVHAFLSILQLTLPTRSADDFFPATKKPVPEKKPRRRSKKKIEPEVGDEIKAESMLVRIVKNATEYTIRTGRDGLDLSPVALLFALRVKAEIGRSARMAAADLLFVFGEFAVSNDTEYVAHCFHAL